MFGFLAYLPSIVYMPHFLIMLLFVYLVITNPKYSFNSVNNFIGNPNIKVTSNNFIVFFIVFASLVNMVFHREKFSQLSDFFPYFILLPVTYYIASVVKPKQWIWLLYFFAFECLIGAFQFITETPTFFPEFFRAPENYDSSLLYYRRAYGLSVSSSTFANKVFLGLLLIDFILPKGKLKNTLLAIFLVGIFVTFNRTVLLAVGFYYGFKFIYNSIEVRFKPSLFYLRFIFVLLVLIGGTFIVFSYSDAIISQFTRDKGELDISGRDHIWAYYLDFISKNIFFGNGGFKYYFINGLHAHNSFIQVVANNGIIISIFYFLLIIKNINRSNLIPVAALLVYSTAQYGVFWGISLMDIILFYFLTRSPGLEDDFPYERENRNWFVKLINPQLFSAKH
jgi:hypothetical protein